MRFTNNRLTGLQTDKTWLGFFTTIINRNFAQKDAKCDLWFDYYNVIINFAQKV